MQYQLPLAAAVAVLLAGCASQSEVPTQSDRSQPGRAIVVPPGPRDKDVALSDSSVMNAAASVYCHLGSGAWHRVLSQSDQGVLIDTRRLDFNTVWKAPVQVAEVPKSRQRKVRWEDLKTPLPDHKVDSWGYALTYRDHKSETVESPAFRFRQGGAVDGNSESIPYRDHLDFELEIGLLMHRDAPDRFGYFLVNDMTDRGVQVRTYDEENPAPGFAQAKGFDGSLRAGPLLAVADASPWPHLSASLSLNGEVRQNLSAARCDLDPGRFHQEVFSDSAGTPWAVVATGTSAGTLFRTPSKGEKLKALVSSGFSLKRAKEAWLGSLRFLAPGDEIVMHSPLLGRSEAKVK